MAYPEKTARNELIIKQKSEGMSFRDIQAYHNFKSVKSVYSIIARSKKRAKNKAR